MKRQNENHTHGQKQRGKKQKNEAHTRKTKYTESKGE